MKYTYKMYCCFSNVTIVIQTRYIVTLYVHSVSFHCIRFDVIQRLSSLLNSFVAVSAPGRKPILLLLQATLRDTLGRFMAVSFNSLPRGFRQAFKPVIMHEHRSLLRFGIDTLVASSLFR
jgi:hypothetical protein